MTTNFLENFAGRYFPRMTSFEKFRWNKLSRIWLKTAKPRKFLPAKVSSFKVSSTTKCKMKDILLNGWKRSGISNTVSRQIEKDDPFE